MTSKIRENKIWSLLTLLKEKIRNSVDPFQGLSISETLATGACERRRGNDGSFVMFVAFPVLFRDPCVIDWHFVI